MKFIVREGFVLTFVERTEQVVNGKKQAVDREYNQYPGDAPFELTEPQARDHAHKLEGGCKAGSAFLASLVRDPSTSVQQAGEPSVPLSKVQEMIDAAIAKAVGGGTKPAGTGSTST